VAHESAVDQLFQLAPGAHVALVDVWNGVWIAGTNITVRRMVIGKWPMDEIEVEVVELEVMEGPFASGNDVFFCMFVVPELGCDPKLFTS
jgi:hypothetical protein